MFSSCVQCSAVQCSSVQFSSVQVPSGGQHTILCEGTLWEPELADGWPGQGQDQGQGQGGQVRVRVRVRVDSFPASFTTLPLERRTMGWDLV
jgi:hypothetical protein